MGRKSPPTLRFRLTSPTHARSLWAARAAAEEEAYQIRFLLSNPAIAERLGEQGHEHVREEFLITSNAKRYLTLFLHLLNSPAP